MATRVQELDAVARTRVGKKKGAGRVAFFFCFVFFSSVIGAAADDFLAGRPQQDGVLELGRVAALDVAQRRVRVDDALVAQVLERHQVFRLVQTVEPAAAEGQRAKVLVDDAQKLLRFGQPASVVNVNKDPQHPFTQRPISSTTGWHTKKKKTKFHVHFRYPHNNIIFRSSLLSLHRPSQQ